jgi:hypothetical protein
VLVAARGSDDETRLPDVEWTALHRRVLHRRAG